MDNKEEDFFEQCKDKEKFIELLKNKTFFREFIEQIQFSYQDFMDIDGKSLQEMFEKDYQWLIENSFHFRVAERFFKPYDEDLKIERMNLEEKIQYKPELKNKFLKDVNCSFVECFPVFLFFILSNFINLFIIFFNIDVFKSSIETLKKTFILLISIPINLVVLLFTIATLYIFIFLLKDVFYNRKIMKKYS